MRFSGTDLIQDEDMDANVSADWDNSNTMTVTPLGADSGPATGLQAYRLTSSATDGEFLRSPGVTISTGLQYGHAWIRGGNASTVDIGMWSADDLFETASIEFLEGPGKATITSGRARISGLSFAQWTIVKLTSNSMVASTDARIYTYPTGETGQSDGEYIDVAPYRWSATAADGWVFDSPAQLRSLSMFQSAGFVLLDGQWFRSLAATVERDMSVVAFARRSGSSAETLFEAWQDASNYCRLHVDTSVVFNCVVGGVNIGVQGGDLSGEGVIVAVIPPAGSAVLYVDAEPIDTTVAGTLTTAGTGTSIGARYDGTQAWTGAVGDVYTHDKALAGSEVRLYRQLALTRIEYASGQVVIG